MKKHNYKVKNALFFVFYFICGWIAAQENSVPEIVIDPKGHSAKISNILYTPNGEKIISVSEDKSIRLWNAASGEQLKKYEAEIGEGSEGALYASALSPDGRLLATAGYAVRSENQNYIIVIDIEKGEQIAIAKGHSDIITVLEFSTNGNTLISGGEDGTIRFWEVGQSDEYKQLSTINHGIPINSISVNYQTNKLAVASREKDIYVYDITEQKEPRDVRPEILKEHQGEVLNVKYSPDGNYLASVSFGGELILWNSSGKPIFNNEEYLYPLNALAFSYDSKVLVALDITGKGYSYAVPSGNSYTKEFKGHDNVVYSAAFNPNSVDGNYVVASAGGTGNEIVLWNAISGKTVRKISGKGSFIGNLQFGKDLSLYINTGFSPEREVFTHIFDFRSLQLEPQPESPPETVVSAINQKISINKDLITLELPRGKKIRNDPGIDGYLHSFTATPDGKVVVGSDFSLKMYDMEGNFLKTFSGHTGGIWALACTEDGKYVASGGEDQTIKIWKVNEVGNVPSLSDYFEGDAIVETLITDLNLEEIAKEETRGAWNKAIEKIREYTDRRTTKFFEEQLTLLGETIVPFANLFLSEDHQWVCWAPSGYFACSASGANYFGWHINNGVNALANYYAADQYFEILYRPDIVGASLPNEKRAQEILREKGEVVFDLGKLSRPSVALFDVSNLTIGDSRILHYEKGKYHTSSQTINLTVDLYDGGGGIREVNIFHNGKLIRNDREVKTLQTVKKIRKTYEVELGNDLNNYKVVVVNFQGIESRPDMLKVEYTGDDLTTSSLHIISVGINQYQKEEYNLNYAKPDAVSFSRKFLQNTSGMFKSIVSHIELYDEQATRENIIYAFEKVISEANPEDMFVFYYAGHGTIDEAGNGEYYLVPPDITQIYGDSKQLQERGISATEIKQYLSMIKSTKQLILMDACHSGAAVETFKNHKDNNERERAITRLARSSGVAMLTSSNSQQFASEFEVLKHGVFTYALLEALDGAADTGDNQVSVYELKLYMERMVPKLSKEYGGDSQKPIAHVFGNDFPISVIKK